MFEIFSSEFSIRIYATQWSLRSEFFWLVSTISLLSWRLWLWLSFAKRISVAWFGPAEMFSSLRSGEFISGGTFIWILRISMCYSCNWCFSKVWKCKTFFCWYSFQICCASMFCLYLSCLNLSWLNWQRWSTTDQIFRICFRWPITTSLRYISWHFDSALIILAELVRGEWCLLSWP